MKFTVEGYSQVEMVARGLDTVDVVLLRWFTDFYHGGMVKIKTDGDDWGLLSYRYLLQELPLIGIRTRQGLYKRMQKLEYSGLIEHRYDAARQRALYRPNEEGIAALLSNTAMDNYPEHLRRKSPVAKHALVDKIGTEIVIAEPVNFRPRSVAESEKPVNSHPRSTRSDVEPVNSRPRSVVQNLHTGKPEFTGPVNCSLHDSSIINSLRPRERGEEHSHPLKLVTRTAKDAFANFGADRRMLESRRESSALQDLVTEAAARSAKHPDSWVKDLVEVFAAIRNSGDSFWSRIPLLPSMAVKPGIFAQLLDQLKLTHAEQNAAKLRAQKEQEARRKELEHRVEVESLEARAESELALAALKARFRRSGGASGGKS